MILAYLDRELAALVGADIAAGTLPPSAAAIPPGRTWRPAPDRNPAGFATSIAFELAALAGNSPDQVAGRLAAPLRNLPWVASAEPAGGYLTITVTPRALGHAIQRIASAGAAAAHSSTLAGTTTIVPPWPDPARARMWQQAWHDHATAMTGRLAQAAGASVKIQTTIGERRTLGADPATAAQSPVADAVDWFGLDPVRYALARTSPGGVAQLDRQLRPGRCGPDPLEHVRQAHESAASTLRWAADLHLQAAEPADLLGSAAEQCLLGLLPWLPVRVSAAAARRRPDELPNFLSEVSAGWLAVRQEAPALPFGGRAAAIDPALAGARLTLASAVRVVLASGLALTGVQLPDRTVEAPGNG
ncbi:MAG: hypothetical protein J2P29_17780 [Actinobacteria bacterium]|nr:hypothetical protein [Actinomycetota bacterium]